MDKNTTGDGYTLAAQGHDGNPVIIMQATRTTIQFPRFWAIEGDDHEQRIVEASTEDEAVEATAGDFAAQYGEPYGVDLLTVLGAFDTEEAAQEAHPGAS